MDDYVRVPCTILAVTGKAVLIDPNDSGDEVWVPRSLLHGGDDRELHEDSAGDWLELRVREWFANREGLT